MDATSNESKITSDEVALNFENRANTADFVGLGFKNFLLGLITLTLYRFWAKTEIRQKIWGNTFLNNEPFEYTGRGIELFYGFLIATGVFTIPYLLIVFGAQLMPPLIAFVVLIVYFIAMMLLIGAAIWLAFRYLSSRTTWRGIRFRLGGKPIDFSLMYIGQSLLQMITIGWWSPKLRVNIAKELWGNMNFGSMPFSFDEKRIDFGKLYGLFAIGWVGMLLAYILFIVVLGADLFGPLMSDPEAFESDPTKFVSVIIKLYAGMFVLMIAALFVYMPYHVAILKSIAGAIKLGNAEFSFDFSISGFIWLWISNILLIVFSMGILTPVAQARSAKFMIKHLKSDGTLDLSKIEQTELGPEQAEGLSDALDIGII